MSTTAPQVYAAINAVSKAMSHEGIAKGRKNQQQGYAFRGIDDVFSALAPHLSSNGLCILPRVTDRTVIERETKAGGNLFYTTLMVEFDFVAVADGSKHTVCMVGEAMDSGDKSSNKAMSAAYKYACFQTFCIPTEGDNDADAQTHELAPIGTPVVHLPTNTPARAPTSTATAGKPIPAGNGDWRSVIVPKFIKKAAGLSLVEWANASPKDVKWWAANFTPKPFRGEVSDADKAFRAALTMAAESIDGEDVPYTEEENPFNQ